jgi:hypothetical protein
MGSGIKERTCVLSSSFQSTIRNNTSMSLRNTAQARRMKTAIAAETGNIQGMAERFIAESHDYLINRIPQASYDNNAGEDPIKIRYSTAPIEDREYVEMLATGENAEGSMPGRDCTGAESSIDTSINNRGAFGCNLPGQTIHGGYDVFSRVLKGKAWETDVICALDLITKMHYNEYIRMLREDLPKRAVEQFGYSLERNVIEMGKYNTSILNGFTFAEGTFPAPPQGTLDLATVRRVFQIMESQGWVGPREVQTSHAAFETMRLNYKNNTNLTLEATLVSSETQYVGADEQVIDWGGIRWVLKNRPTRGYLRTTSTGYEFVPVRPIIARAGTGQGVVSDINEDYFNASSYCEGERRELYEIGFYIAPNAARRESFAVPQVADKRFSQSMFNFEVSMIDGAYLDCNVDNLKFFFRMLHAYAFESTNPELMGAIIYRVQPDIIYVNEPSNNRPEDTDDDNVTLGGALPQQHNDCSYEDQTDDSEALAQAVLPEPTEDDPVPTPGAGQLRWYNAGPLTTEQDAGSIKVWVERIGGVLGAATATVGTVEGTATDPEDFTHTLAQVLSWADGEAGRKSITVPIVAAATAGSVFTVAKSAQTGASWTGATSVSITIDSAFDALP